MTAPLPPAMASSPAAGRRLWRSGAFWILVVIVLCGLLAPLLANDVPLVARVGGQWQFPAFVDLFGAPPVGPGDLTWKQWWSRLPAGGEDFAWMPPWPHGPTEADPARFRLGPSWSHPFGNDDTGRDLLARVIHGARPVVELGLPAVMLGGLIGTLLGAWAGLRRGWVDVVVLRAIELFSCFPTLLMLLLAQASFGDSRLAAVLVLAALFWTSFARMVRGEMLSLRERDFVHVARGLGVAERRISGRHLLPLVRGRIGVTAAFALATATVVESTLAFLGLGTGPAGGSWGQMLRQGSENAATGAWHLWLFPAAAILGMVVACHRLAESLASGPERV